MTSVNAGSPFPILYSDSANLDGFSRIRTSSPVGLFSSKMVYDNQPLIYDDQQVSGGSTSSTYNTNQASVTLLATGNAAGQRVRQSFLRPIYQPGRSQLITLTGIINASGSGATGITRRIGQFDGYNGFYFQYGGTPGVSAISVGLRTYTSGSAVDTLVASTSWNIDKFDGTGPSKVTLDTTKTQIFIIDYQWLGVGRIRFGFDVAGSIYYCHQILIANTQALVSISNPDNPIRYEITSDGTGSSATATLVQICAGVSSEGGDVVVGFPFSVSTGVSSITTGNNTTAVPIIAMQLQSGKTGANINIQSASIMSATANATFLFQVWLNPTLTGTALSYSTITNSSIQYALGTTETTLSGGTLIHQEYVGAQKTASTLSIDTSANLGTYISGVGEQLVFSLASVPSAANTSYLAINWLEQN